MKPTDWREVFHLVQREGRVNVAGPRIRAWREERAAVERGWTVEGLGRLLGVDKSVVSKLERGQRLPTLDEALRIVEIFDRTLADLLLPDDVSGDLRTAIDGWALYDEAERLNVEMEAIWDRYERAVSELRKRMNHQSIANYAVQLRRFHEEHYRDAWEAKAGSANYPDDLGAFAALQDPTPAGVLARDVLGTHDMPTAPWAYRGATPAHWVDQTLGDQQ